MLRMHLYPIRIVIPPLLPAFIGQLVLYPLFRVGAWVKSGFVIGAALTQPIYFRVFVVIVGRMFMTEELPATLVVVYGATAYKPQASIDTFITSGVIALGRNAIPAISVVSFIALVAHLSFLYVDSASRTR